MAYDPPAVLNDILQVTLRTQQFEQNYQTSFYYQVSNVGIPGTPAYTDLMDVFESDIWSELRAFMSNTVVNVVFRVQKVFPLPRLLFRVRPAVPPTGLSAVATLPPTTAAVLRAYAALATPEGRGRNFLFGLTTDQNEEGQIPAAAFNNWLTLAELIYEDALVGAGYTWTPVLFAPFKPGPPPVAAHTSPIVASGVNRVLRVQRRREIGVGE